MAMATSCDSTTHDLVVKEQQPFPLMSLHPELRQMVYHEVFSRRGITLYEDWAFRGCTPSWQFYLTNHSDHDVISLLQTSRQVLAEAAPLLKRYTPSHLAVSKTLQRQPLYIYRDELIDCGLPFQHIRVLSFNVKSVGNNQRHCPCESTDGIIRWSGSRDRSEQECVPDHPDLTGIHKFSQIFAMLPALQEIHVYDVLEYHLNHQPYKCPSPIKGSETCTCCGKCECFCAVCLPLPTTPNTSIAATRDLLHKALLLSFRTALPSPSPELSRIFSNYLAIIRPLAYGVRVFFHGELTIKVPIERGRSLHKGLWRATYCLNPPDDATPPAKVSVEVAETPARLRLKKEEEVEKRRLRMEQELDSPWDFDGFLNTSEYMLDFSTSLSHEDPLDSSQIVPEAIDGKPLISFEHGLEIELVDEETFDTVFENGSLEAHKTMLEKKFGKLWHWD